MTTTRKQPEDHKPPAAEQDEHPAGWELLKPFADVPVWDQAELLEIVKPLMPSGDAAEGEQVEFDVMDFDFRQAGELAKKLQEFAVDPDAYIKFVSGPGALTRATNLGIAYATQLGE